MANLPQFADLIDTVTRNQRGSIGSTMKDLNASIDQFAQLAAETKNATAMSQVEGVRKQIADYGELLKSLFRDTMDPVLADVAAGYGLDTAFTKARDGVIKTADSYRGLIADVREAFSYDTTKLDTLKADHDKAVAEIEATKNSQLAAMDAANRAKISNTGLNKAGDRLPIIGITREMMDLPPARISEDQEAEYAKQIAEAGTKRDEAVAAYEAQIAEVKGKYDLAVHTAIMAAREGLLRLVSGDVREQSAVEQALAEARGAAAGLDLALKDLGMSAEEASAAIETAIGKRRDLLARDFTEGLQDSIADLDGKGYLADLRELTKSIETMMADANLLNVDTSLVDTFFTKQAQAIVDGSELTGEAFDELIRLFPNLTGKVHAFADAVEEAGRSAAEVAARMQSANDRYFTATTDTSTLSGAMSAFNRRRMVEVQAESALGGGAMLQLEAALAAEKVNLIQGLLRSAYETERQEIEETISRLQSLSDEWGDLRKSLLLDDNLSPLSQKDQFLEAQKQFRELSAKAAAGDEDAQAKLAGISSSYLEEAKAYYASSEDYYAAFNEVQGVLANSESLAQQQLNAAKSQLDIAKAQLDAMTGVKESIASLQAALVEAMAAAAKFVPAMGGAPAAGTAPPATTGGLPGGSYSVSTQSSAYLANNPDVAAAIAAGETFGLPAGTSANVIAAAHYGIHGQTEGRGWQRGGLIPGFAKGGMIGNGQWNRDSVVARYAGGGEIALAGGEMVVSAPRVTPQTYPVLDHINRTGRVPANEGMRLDRVEQLLRTLIATTGGGLERVAATGEQGNRSAEQMALASRRASSNKQAA
ncbi:hypothetical protein ASG43_20560 [Aureimonas sp. Leaf454]|uniref:hypothetical protein n=1 Tax=Aureimonas sp. Leaf454 TaxID=1736381 RepID=UPI0006F36A70|nr:hypothetical protein [Aureimonas sp. Leaf454]KQT51975.1 hypothetical protein ASG43_20560 [Aureimonas sp. Leaf454]